MLTLARTEPVHSTRPMRLFEAARCDIPVHESDSYNDGNQLRCANHESACNISTSHSSRKHHEMPYINRGRSELYYESYGDGPTLVLLHGVGGNHASWFYQVQAWSEKFRIITIDARGFGNSSDVEGLGRAAFTDDLAHLLDQLGIASTAIVAQSMGGGTAVDFACRHPDRVDALVLADTLIWLDPPADMAQAYAQVLASTERLSQSERVLGATFRATHPSMNRLYLQIASFNRYTFKTLPGKQTRYRPESLARTAVPICFVVGEEDVLFPPALVSQVAERIPDAAYFSLPKAGHSAYFETPDAFNEWVGNWLSTQTACASANQ